MNKATIQLRPSEIFFFSGWTYQLMAENQPKFNLLAAEKQCVCVWMSIGIYM